MTIAYSKGEFCFRVVAATSQYYSVYGMEECFTPWGLYIPLTTAPGCPTDYFKYGKLFGSGYGVKENGKFLYGALITHEGKLLLLQTLGGNPFVVEVPIGPESVFAANVIDDKAEAMAAVVDYNRINNIQVSAHDIISEASETIMFTADPTMHVTVRLDDIVSQLVERGCTVDWNYKRRTFLEKQQAKSGSK